MRYLIESKEEHAMGIGATISRLEKEGKINIIEKGDPIEQIKIEMLKIRKAFETLEKIGINKDVLIAYIKSKGISRKSIDDVLYYQNEFFKKLGLK